MSADLNNGAFCVLPFIEKFQNLNGKRYVCCHSDIPVDSQKVIQIQQNIYNGIKVPECSGCYQKESKNTISPRQRESVRWLKDSEVKKYVGSWTPDTKSKTFFYDVRYSNKCNLACISCNPKDSSLWAKELNIEVEKNTLDFTIEELISAKQIYLAGGEPLIIDEFLQLIDTIADQDTQPELVINTNLTRVTDDLKYTLSKIKNLTLNVSIDAYESVNEYHRWPLRWPKLIDNLRWVSDNVSATIRITTVVDAVSIFNIDQLINIESLFDQWYLVVLNTPNSLLIENLPNYLKNQIADNFKKIKKSKFYTTDPEFKTTVDHILLQIFESGDPKLLSKYIANLDRRRNINHENYLGAVLI